MSWQPPSEEEFVNEWIRPDDLLEEPPHRIEGFDEKRAIMEELRAGILVAVARKAEVDGKLMELVLVPKRAWQTTTHSQEEHFWQSGQLITTVGGITGYGDGKTERYFDIRFGPQQPDPVRAAIMAAGPDNPISELELQLTSGEPLDPSDYASWITPGVALKRLDGLLTPLESCTELYRRLRGGELLCVARYAIWHCRDTLEVKDFRILGGMLWAFNDPPNQLDLFWKTGSITLSRPDYPQATRMNVECFGVRFEPGGIHQILVDAGVTSTDQTEPSAGSSPNKGGRPPKTFWEDLLIEMARQLFNGDLQPERQADIENAMHDWLAANGHRAGETQVRARARKLWETTQI